MGWFSSMMNPKIKWGVGGAILIVLLIVGFKLIPPPKPKPNPPRTAQQIAQNECTRQIYTKYIKDKLALSQSQGSPLHWTVESVIAQRRLEEQFCMQFVQCGKTTSTTAENVSNGIDAINFDNCLRDEAMQDYNAIPRDEMDEEKDD
jgi:hypothetical protein